MRAQNKKLFIVLALGLTAVACGEKKASKVGDGAPVFAGVQKTTGSGSAAGSESGCANGECAPATMDVAAEGKTDAGLFVGVVGEPVPWTFKGVAAEDGREVAILLNKIPKGAEIDPPQDGTTAATDVKIVWTPDTAQTSKDDLEVYARDLTRCKAVETGDKCHANKVLKKYDVKIAAVKWEVVKSDAVQAADPAAPAAANPVADALVVKVSDPNCGGIKGTSQQQIQSTVLQTGLKVITGGGIQALLPGLLGTLLNSKGAPPGGGTAPQKC